MSHFFRMEGSHNSSKESKNIRDASGDQGETAQKRGLYTRPWLIPEQEPKLEQEIGPSSKEEAEVRHKNSRFPSNEAEVRHKNLGSLPNSAKLKDTQEPLPGPRTSDAAILQPNSPGRIESQNPESIEGKLRELIKLVDDSNEILNQYREKTKVDIEKTNTVKRFQRWWEQERLKLQKDVQTLRKKDEVTIGDLSNWINKLEKLKKTFPKEFKEVEKLYEMIESCSEEYKEDQRTLDLAPNIKKLRRLVIAFVEFNDEEALKRVGEQLPNRSKLPRNEALPNLPDQDLMVLKVAQGMQVIHRSKTEQSKYTREAFEKYAPHTKIKYHKESGRIEINKLVKGECRYRVLIDFEKEEMAFFNSRRISGPHFSDHIVGDLQLLSSILNDDRRWEKCMSEEDLKNAKKDYIAQKLGMFKPKKMRHDTISNKETLGTKALAKKLYETETFIFDPDHKTYPACIAMLATHLGYRSIFLVNQHEKFSDLRITKIEQVDPDFADIEITLEPKR